MPPRTLGGGRVLGSGKNLSPAVPTPSPSTTPKAHILSPAASSASLDSDISSEAQDLTSRISLENGETSISTAASTADHLLCPICNEEMVTLLQLNRHLDDAHQNLEEVRQDEVKDWFKVQVTRAKKFQPLAVLNQKLKGLDVFESNENAQTSVSVPPRPAAQSTAVPPPEPKLPDPDEVVTREHWQTRSPYDVCNEPSCGKRLNATNGSVNCRKCGLLFCEEHTMYQMKLSRSAQHEPVRGLWCRVCETCYKSREGYNDHHGVTQDLTESFKAIRREKTNQKYLELSRLETRLTRLTKLLASLPSDQVQAGTNRRWSLGWEEDKRKALERTIVGWQDDASVSQCPFCQQEFTAYTFRRHHCRTCGRVVCGDETTGCSSEVPLTIQKPDGSLEKSVPTRLNVDIRLCKECQATLFSHRDFEADRSRRPPDERTYENLLQFERGIRLLLPKFQKLLTALQDPNQPPTSLQLQEAAKIRKRLIDSFGQYDKAARRIRDLPTESPTQKKLQKAIYQQATNFLHLHMLPLKSLPKVLKHATPNGRLPNESPVRSGTSSPAPGARSRVSALASIGYAGNGANTSTNSVASDNSSAISALEAEEKALRERLIVLEEQKFFVSEMIADANKRRKFDEVSSLAMNVEDLTKEIDHVSGQLNKLDFEGIYTGTQPRA